SALGYAVRVVPGNAALPEPAATGRDAGRTRTVRTAPIRHRSRFGNAARQASTHEPYRKTQSRVQRTNPEHRGNAGPWTAVENRPRWRDGRGAPVPTAAHRPGKRSRVFHIPSAPSALLFSSSKPTKR